MCGRYYVDDDTVREIEKLVHQIDSKLSHRGDVNPSQKASVITAGMASQLQLAEMWWGFPQYKGKGLLINARAETVVERKMFRDSVLHRRCIVPARGFYEWDKEKNKVSFTSVTGGLLYMAGFYNRFQDQERFVIITTEANDTVCPIHDRMPLILDGKELESWVEDDQFLEYALKKTPALLQRRQEYEQQQLVL